MKGWVRDRGNIPREVIRASSAGTLRRPATVTQRELDLCPRVAEFKDIVTPRSAGKVRTRSSTWGTCRSVSGASPGLWPSFSSERPAGISSWLCLFEVSARSSPTLLGVSLADYVDSSTLPTAEHREGSPQQLASTLLIALAHQTSHRLLEEDIHQKASSTPILEEKWHEARGPTHGDHRKPRANPANGANQVDRATTLAPRLRGLPKTQALTEKWQREHASGQRSTAKTMPRPSSQGVLTTDTPVGTSSPFGIRTDAGQ
ncbi:uncharacterized protein BO66DRAFT_438953 [Aspergillus aculeatinus CBS 121060]|uniref:Uncharacterized protein n=1 Tax=Aspergillus aculeatinus CBS 121060 TaxID=1448322 RepID=A0ACD1H914_9EURO|nr:hypothetical protein BO66DRAFT_438953 [Aspergillus aculeatinus CBS 121060]RAH69880.1 hypothetical protein BO66DRAFT_438953 [Aspergillus aculeatinus CBS 121060]